jgi:hypothetical protein
MKSPNISDLIDCKEAELTDKLLDYYDGEQVEHLIKIMNDPNKGRKEWQSKGIIPRTRNILKMVVDKSGLLFSDKAPSLEVYAGPNVDENQSAKLQSFLEDLDWVEFFTNFDVVVRMLKTACILVQFDNESKKLYFSILNQQNSAVVMNKSRTAIDTLVYCTSGECEDDEDMEYRVYTVDLIQDIAVDAQGHERIIQSVPNPFGIIPLVAFHDTNTPRTDFWNEIPTDLLQINEMYNLHLTDSEYAASWAKVKTIVTNAKILADEAVTSTQEIYGSALPRQVPGGGASTIGGPGRVIQIDDSQTTNGMVFDWKGPDVNLEPIDNMFNKWVADFAADWAVNVKDANGGVADSGFKLIVEEMPNLELRKKRARMFEAGFKRLFRVIRVVLNTYIPGVFSEDAELFAQFSAPSLPVDKTVEENLWSRKIAEGRASRVDYFMETKGMTRDEAIAKVTEIDNDNSAKAASVNIQKFNVALGNSQGQ